MIHTLIYILNNIKILNNLKYYFIEKVMEMKQI